MTKLVKLMNSFRKEEDGAAMIEYTILLGIIAVAVIATIILVGTWVSGQWTTFEGLLPTAPTT